MFTDGNNFEPPIELRPFPVSGNLLSNVGLPGGWAYQVIENFFRKVGSELFGVRSDKPLDEALTGLAANAPVGADGLVCEPTFSGTVRRRVKTSH